MIQITHLSYSEFFKKNGCYFLFILFTKIWANLTLNYSFLPKRDFSGKIDYHNLCLRSRAHHPKTLQINTKLHNFGPNWVQIAHLLQNRCFGKIDFEYCMTIVFFYATIFKKIPQKANNKTEDCIILAQTWCELYLQTTMFWKIWPRLLWYSYCIPFYFVIS